MENIECSERINLTNECNQNTFLYYLLISVTTTYCLNSNKYEEYFCKDVVKDEGSFVNAHVIVNGHSISIREFAAKIESQLDHIVAEKAEELIRKRCDKMTDLIERMQHDMLAAFPELDREY